MVILAFLTDPAVVRKILDDLQLPTQLPPVAPIRLPCDGQEEFRFADPDPAWDDPPHADPSLGPASQTARPPP